MNTSQKHGPRAGRIVSIAAAALVLAAIPLAPAWAGKDDKPSPVKGGATYSGITAQGSICTSTDDQPCSVSIGVNKKGTRTNAIAIKVKSFCDNGSDVNTTIEGTPHLPINARGKMKVLIVIDPGEGTQTSTGLHFTVAKAEIPFEARFRRTGKQYTAEGTIDMTRVLTYDDGTTTTCKSGLVTYAIPAG